MVSAFPARFRLRRRGAARGGLHSSCSPLVFASLMLAPVAASAGDVALELPPIEVEGKLQPSPVLSGSSVNAAEEKGAEVDTAGLLQGQPGAAVVRNGPQTGIVQLRGLHNERVRVRVDGMAITPACPNHMDPPLHFLMPSDVETFEVLPGVTPVSQGGDSIAGTVTATSQRPRYADGPEVQPSFDSHVLYRGANSGLDTGVGAAVAGERTSLGYRYQFLKGSDQRFPGGKIRDSGYESQDHSLRFRRDIGKGQLDLDVGFFDGEEAGTPALPMDVVKDEAIRTNAALERRFGFGTVRTRVYGHSIDHRMDNFSLRPAGMMRMFSPAESDDVGVSTDVETVRESGAWRFGAEFLHNSHEAYQENASTGARQDTFRDATRARFGLYGEWEKAILPKWTTSLGLRSDTVWSDAGDVVDFFGMSAADAAAFNAAGHSFADVNFDATASLRWDPRDDWSVELSAARKTRSPSTLERYLWTPLSASAGQADGRTYLGNLGLDPEVSHQVNLAVLWQRGTFSVQPSAFYNRVQDYIQGQPIARNDSAGLPVLQYENLEAELYGADGAVAWTPAPAWKLGAVLSYVRGRNLDLDDDLYRIAPLSTTLQAEYRIGRWRHVSEVRIAAAQHDVARTNDERTTASYALWNLRTAFEVKKGITIEGGIENLLDNRYADHLSGVNRVMDSDVAVGDRLPGPGRFVYVGLTIEK